MVWGRFAIGLATGHPLVNRSAAGAQPIDNILGAN